MKRKMLCFLLFLICLCFSFDGEAFAAKVDYAFPDYVAVGGKVWKADWRTKKGDKFENNRGSEKVVEKDLSQLNTTNIQLNCVKFTEDVVAVQERGKWVARKISTNETVANYCEAGYNVKFTQALASGSMAQDDKGNWFLQVCSFHAQSLDEKINELADPNNISMTLVDGRNYKVTFNAMAKYPGVFRIKNLVSQVYYDDDGNRQVAFDHFRYDNSVITGENSLLIPAGTDFYVEFYVNGSSPGCTEEFVAQIRSGAPKSIPNPVLSYKNASGQNLCQALKDKYGSTDGVVTGMVPFCFRENVNYDEAVPSVEEVIAQSNQVDSLLNGQNDVSKNTTAPIRLCNFLKSGSDGLKNTTGTAEAIAAGNIYTVKIENKYLDFSKSLEYWRANCTEEMKVMYDDPKAVNAGGGFSYTTIIEITRTCTPYQIKTPRKKPKCEYSADCMGKGHTGGPGAGPTEEFDQCINTCDGGKYSQACIDSCYEEVYGDTNAKTVSFTDQAGLGRLTYDTKSGKTGIVQVARTGSYRTDCSLLNRTDRTPRPISSCYVLGGNGGCQKRNPDDACPTCYTEHGVAVWYCDGCNGSGRGSTDGVQCYEVWASTSDCAINPELDYYNQVKKALSEYQTLVARMRKYTEDDYKDESIYTGVYDNYLDKQVEFGKNQQPITDLSIDSSVSDAQQKMISSTTQGGAYAVTTDMLTYTWQKYTTVRKQTVHLTQAYVSNTTNQQVGAGTVYQKKTMDCVRDDKNHDLCQKYYNGGYKYYTDLFTPTINNWKDWPYYNVNNKDYSIKKFHDKGERYENIDVDLRNFGSWNQWSLDIDCIYGLFQNFIGQEDNSPDPDCDPSKDICSGGIQYIYREIELEDNFPNERNPRWNWTGTIDSKSVDGVRLVSGAARTDKRSYRGYNVDPYALIEHIEHNGNTIYDVQKDSSEVDYEFVLTRQNLRNIRAYNKSVEDFNRDGYNNYADYDTSCYTKRINGQDIEVCTNNFLDDDRYITYSTPGFTSTSRKGIAGCNNAKNQKCYDISSKN